MKKIYALVALSLAVSMSFFSVSAFAQNNDVMTTEIIQNVDEDINATDEVTPGKDNSTDDTTPEDEDED